MSSYLETRPVKVKSKIEAFDEALTHIKAYAPPNANLYKRLHPRHARKHRNWCKNFAPEHGRTDESTANPEKLVLVPPSTTPLFK